MRGSNSAGWLAWIFAKMASRPAGAVVGVWATAMSSADRPCIHLFRSPRAGRDMLDGASPSPEMSPLASLPICAHRSGALLIASISRTVPMPAGDDNSPFFRWWRNHPWSRTAPTIPATQPLSRHPRSAASETTETICRCLAAKSRWSSRTPAGVSNPNSCWLSTTACRSRLDLVQSAQRRGGGGMRERSSHRPTPDRPR